MWGGGGGGRVGGGREGCWSSGSEQPGVGAGGKAVKASISPLHAEGLHSGD
jgi:hypothetical protein